MMVIGGQNDPTVTPSYLDNLYATMPTATQSDFVQIAGAEDLFFTHANNMEMKVLIPWLKMSKCPYVPSGPASPSPSVTSPSSSPSQSSPATACAASYRTVNSWPGGLLADGTPSASSLTCTSP